MVAIGGDGAFAMNGMEIHTAVDNDIPVIWIVLNNGGHGMVHHGDRILMNRCLESSAFKVPIDVAGLARSLGARVQGRRTDAPGAVVALDRAWPGRRGIRADLRARRGRAAPQRP